VSNSLGKLSAIASLKTEQYSAGLKKMQTETQAGVGAIQRQFSSIQSLKNDVGSIRWQVGLASFTRALGYARQIGSIIEQAGAAAADRLHRGVGELNDVHRVQNAEAVRGLWGVLGGMTTDILGGAVRGARQVGSWVGTGDNTYDMTSVRADPNRQRQLQTIEDQISSLRNENQLIGLSGARRQQWLDEQQRAAAMQRGATRAQLEELERELRARRELTLAYEKRTAWLNLEREQRTRRLEEARGQMGQLREMARDLGSPIDRLRDQVRDFLRESRGLNSTQQARGLARLFEGANVGQMSPLAANAERGSVEAVTILANAQREQVSLSQSVISWLQALDQRAAEAITVDREIRDAVRAHPLFKDLFVRN
jgi:hypothetical protein